MLANVICYQLILTLCLPWYVTGVGTDSRLSRKITSRPVNGYHHCSNTFKDSDVIDGNLRYCIEVGNNIIMVIMN